jgi:hypothetical protein
VDNIRQFKAVKELQIKYRQWREDPMTQMVMDTVREVFPAQMPLVQQMDKPLENLAIMFAKQAGIEEALTAAMNLHKGFEVSGEEVEAKWEETEGGANGQ